VSTSRKHVRGQGTVFQRGDVWHVCYSVNGKTFRESARTEVRDEALAYLQRKLGRVASGETLPPDRVKIKDLLRLVESDYELKERASLYIAKLKINRYLLPAFGEVKPTKLTSSHVHSYIRQRQRDGAKPATINRELSLVHRGFTLGYEAEPPMVARVPKLIKLQENNTRTGFLQPSAYRKLLIELPAPLRILFVFGYHLGMRKGELLKIRKDQIDRKAKLIGLEGKQTKNRNPRTAPIYGDMEAFLDLQPENDSPYLFTWLDHDRIKDFRNSWQNACTRAGVPNLLFHDLRRTAVRNMRRAGIDPQRIKRIIGHKSDSMFERYNIIDEEDIRDAGRKVERFLRKQHEIGKLEPKETVQ
jgi:integrase